MTRLAAARGAGSAALLLAIVACDVERAEPDATRAVADAPLARCGTDGPLVLTGDGVGALRIGATVEQVALACRVASDTTEPGPEGSTERVLTVILGEGPDTLQAIVSPAGDSIARLHVTSPRVRTVDSLGVGSRIGALRAMTGAQLINGEGGLFVVARDPCGLSFRLDQPDGARRPSLAALPDSARATEVLVIGCR